MKKKQPVKQQQAPEPEFQVKLLKPRNLSQRLAINSIRDEDVTILKGPAGTGKTYIAAAMSLDLLLSGQIEKIILTRPYVSAGEKMGFLPGDMDEKWAPYLEPYEDCFIERVGYQRMGKMFKTGQILVKPLNFLQGKTFNHCVILADEIENAKEEQIKLILTRMGSGCRAILMGDTDQTYIHNSGFPRALEVLKNVPKLNIVSFSIEEVVRSEMCKNVLKAYAVAK